MTSLTVLEVKKRLSAVWHKESDKTETYEFDLSGDTAWGCMRRNSTGASRFKLNYDAKAERLWWGQSYFQDASDLSAKPDKLVWFRASDPGKKRGAFTWKRLRDAPLQVQAKAQPKQYDKSTPSKYQVKPQPVSPSISVKAKSSASPKGDVYAFNETSSGTAVSRTVHQGRAGRPSPELILNLSKMAVIYKPPYWKCELPETGSKHKDLLLPNWVKERITDIDEHLFDENFNPALSGTGFGPLAHRIDGETSGILLIVKTSDAQKHIKAQFHKTQVSKRYVCLVHGLVKAREGLIDASIRTVRTDTTTRSEVASTGEWAETKYQVIATFRGAHRNREHASVPPGYTLVACDIKSGRTHQIRIHMLHLGHPLVSDPKYISAHGLSEDRSWCPRLFLHSYRVCFRDTTDEEVLVTCPIPDDLRQAVLTLGAADAEIEDDLYGETSWQREVLRPPRLQWRPGNALQRKVAEVLSQESEPVALNSLNGMPELRVLMSDEGISGIGKPWLMKHWEIFEIIPDPSTADICVRLRAAAGDDEVLGIDLDRQIESVQSEIESLQQQKQRAVAGEEYQQAAEIKRRAEAVSQQLESLIILRAEYLQDAKDGDEGDDGGQARAEMQTKKKRATAEVFTQDVKDETLFPSLGGSGYTAKPSAQSLNREARSASRTRVAASSRDVSVDSRVAVSEVSFDDSAAQVDLKDALIELLTNREGYVAHINEINNDRFMRQVLRAQIPKPMTAVTKGWLTFHEDVFAVLRSQDGEMYVALEKKARPVDAKTAEASKSKARGEKPANEKVTPAYHQVVQKMPGSAGSTLVYDYSAVAQKETKAAPADGTSDWTEKFVAVLNRAPQRFCSIDELLEAVPEFAKGMGARRINEQRALLLMFLQGCSESFQTKKEGFGASQRVNVYAK